MTDKSSRRVCQGYGLLEKVTSQLFDGEDSAEVESAGSQIRYHLIKKE